MVVPMKPQHAGAAGVPVALAERERRGRPGHAADWLGTARPLARPIATLRHPSQLAVLVIGLVYLLVGLAGMLLDHLGEGQHGSVLGFQLGMAHNLVRVNVGLAGMLMWAELHTARRFGRLLSVAYGLTVVIGLFEGGQVGIPPVHGTDGLLHLFNAVAANWPQSRPLGE